MQVNGGVGLGKGWSKHLKFVKPSYFIYRVSLVLHKEIHFLYLFWLETNTSESNRIMIYIDVCKMYLFIAGH